MVAWGRSSVTKAQLLDLVRMGCLPPRTEALEWVLPGDDDESHPSDGYVVSFTLFHTCGLGSPPHWFLRGLLDYLQLELHHLNPNDI